MSDLRIDEEEIASVVKRAEKAREDLKKLVHMVKNKEDDIFKRYNAYVTIRTFLDANNYISTIRNNCFTYGYYAAHEVFDTKEAKEHGFGSDFERIGENPFFEQKECMHDDPLSFLQEAIKRALEPLNDILPGKENKTH